MAAQVADIDLPRELSELIASRRCVAFIGSGVSGGVYPSWMELLNKLLRFCGISRQLTGDNTPSDYLAAAEEAKLKDKNKYYEFLLSIFGGHVSITRQLYSILLDLNFKSYLTTNFDRLLALQARHARIPCSPNLRAYPNLDRAEIGNRVLFHIHGLIEEDMLPFDGQLVLAKSEFDEAYHSNSPLTHFLVPTIEKEHMCFIGCTLSEPTMEFIFSLCKQHQTKRRDIALQLGRTPEPPPQRFILVAIPEHADGARNTKREQELENLYESFDIQAVWYSAPEGNHVSMEKAFERLAKLGAVVATY